MSLSLVLYTPLDDTSLLAWVVICAVNEKALASVPMDFRLVSKALVYSGRKASFVDHDAIWCFHRSLDGEKKGQNTLVMSIFAFVESVGDDGNLLCRTQSICFGQRGRGFQWTLAVPVNGRGEDFHAVGLVDESAKIVSDDLDIRFRILFRTASLLGNTNV